MAASAPDMPRDRAVVRATEETYVLGEGVTWDHRRDRLLWVDIEAGLVLAAPWAHVDGPLEVRVVHRGTRPAGCIALSQDGGLLVADGTDVLRLSPDGDVLDRTHVLEVSHAAGTDARLLTEPRRLNDGACDPQGRFLVGTLARHPDPSDPHELLLRCEHDGGVTVLRDRVTLSNGIAFSPDGATVYHVDTLARTVASAPYVPGPLTWATLLTVDSGFPDGMCVDAEGHLWIAVWGAGEVRRYTPTGDHVDSVIVPAPHVTSAAFVGPALTTLAITTARQDLDTAQLAAHPGSGAVFLAETRTRGLLPFRWPGGAT